MKLLSIDSSGKTAACAVTCDGKLIADSFTDSGLTHSQTLLPTVDNVLKQAGISMADIDAVALTVGPGSFTGLRIGAALAMGLAGNKPIYPIPTLEALAYNLIDKDCIIIPTLDARRNQVYTAVFESKNGGITRLKEDCAMSVDAVCESILEYNGRDIYFLGDGAYLFKDVEGVCFAKGNSLYPKGISIAKAAANYTPVAAKDIKLSYLRLSQAERELKEKQKND